jgi:transcriptional regulator with XRE-family HTH domain
MGPQRDFLNQPPSESKSLRRLRLRAGLSQGQLAERLGVTCYAIRAWEKGQRPVRKAWRFKLADALGCRVADLHWPEGIAHRKRWRRAWVNLTAPSNAPTARSWDDTE